MTKIRVALRLRPLSDREEKGGFPVVVAVEDNSAFITDIRVPERPKADSRARYRQFSFDHGFWLDEYASEGAGQSEIYREIGPPLEKSILQGYNACLLAYGQSGTGKTHTMLGSKAEPGIIPRLCHSLWDKLTVKEEDSAFRMEVSFMEIYREKVRDLLTPSSPLKLREHPQYGPHVQNLSRMSVTGEMGLLDLLWEGESRRAIGTTGSNRRSSRSHAIWTIYLTTTQGITNQVHLVDLAGSEKAGFTTAKNLLAEGADINRSLVALGNVISSLAEKAQYIPYRDSALTWLLKDSLGGNATTAIIITASPASCCHAQTLNSFRFAERARQIENSPRVSSGSFPSTGGGTSSSSIPTSSALYSIMSAFEIKKDISRLSRLIRTAQTNGGILRGLAPRASWSRLVNALEGWNQIEGEQVKLAQQRERSMSEDLNAGRATSSDVMIQTNLTSSTSSFPTTTTTTTSSPSTSKQNSPNRIIKGTEVFIPSSNSIKCLTWQQEEPLPPPKLPKSLQETIEEDLYCSVRMTPPSTPTASVKVHHLKNLFPMQFPTVHHLDHASRISEKIHGSFSSNIPPLEKPEVVEIPNPFHTCNCTGDSEESSEGIVLIRDRIPTYVSSKEISPPIFRTCCSERKLFPPEKIRGISQVHNSIRGSKSSEDFVHLDMDFLNVSESSETQINQIQSCQHCSSESSTTLDEFSIPSRSTIDGLGFESMDTDECSEEELTGISNLINKASKSRSYRMVRSNLAKKQNFTLKSQCPSSFRQGDQDKQKFIFEHQDYFEISEQVLQNGGAKVGSQYRAISGAKDESEDIFLDDAEALSNSIKRPCLVHVIAEESDSEEFLEESFSEMLNNFEKDLKMDCLHDQDLEDYNNYNYYQPHLVNVVCIDVENAQYVSDCVEPEDPADCFEFESKPSSGIVLDGASGSKFRNHFAQNIYQIEKFGQKLQQMSQRFNIVKPFVDKIVDLKEDDHNKPDEKLDAEIESCCGWNVDIELEKVNQEINSLSKLLRTGIVPLPTPTSCNRNGISYSRRDSTTSTATNASSATDLDSSSSVVLPRIAPHSNNKSRMSSVSVAVGKNLKRNLSSELLLPARSSHSAPLPLLRSQRERHLHYPEEQYSVKNPGQFYAQKWQGLSNGYNPNSSQTFVPPMGHYPHPVSNKYNLSHPYQNLHHPHPHHHHHPLSPEMSPISSWEEQRNIAPTPTSTSHQNPNRTREIYNLNQHKDINHISSCSSVNPSPNYYVTGTPTSSHSHRPSKSSEFCSCLDTTLSQSSTSTYGNGNRGTGATPTSSHLFSPRSSRTPSSTSSTDSFNNELTYQHHRPQITYNNLSSHNLNNFNRSIFDGPSYHNSRANSNPNGPRPSSTIPTPCSSLFKNHQQRHF